MSGEAWQASWWRRVKVRLIAAAGFRAMSLVGATLRWRVEGLEYFDALQRDGRQPIMGFWHGRILPATLYFRDRGIVVMTSRNFDGEWIARIIERFGYGTARGSSSRGGPQALREMARALRAGSPVGFTLDGPRGPARQAQPGALWLSGATGHPVLPFHLEASRAWTARSWDGTQVPKPFSTVALTIGEPMTLPEGSGEQAIQTATAELQRRLAVLDARARALAGKGGADA